MPQLKIGVQLASLAHPLPKALPLAAKLGADAVEFDARWTLPPSQLSQTALRQLRKTLDDHRLRVSGISYITRRGYNVLHDLDARVHGTKQAMEMAYALGTPIVFNRIDLIPADSDSSEWALLVEVLADLGRHGQRVGALLAAQTGRASAADLARLISALPEGSLNVDLDPGRSILHGHTPAEMIDQLSSHIVHVRATDAAYDPSRLHGIEVPLGRGSVDFPSLLGALEERSYRGYFTVGRPGMNDPEREIGQEIKYLRSL